MTRLSATVLVLALAALLLGSAPGVAAPAPRAQLRDFVCHRALDPPNRSVSITATMRPLRATRRLELKFELLVRGRAHSAARSLVRAGDLGVWISPKDPTLGQLPGDLWNFDKSVVELGAPADYQFRVSFRWVGTRNRVIGSDVLYSRGCREAELRPDLLVRSISVSAIPHHPLTDLYKLVIANAGATAAGPFKLLFAPGDGSAPKTRTVRRLGAHASRIEAFVGPACTAASAPTVTVDSAGQIDDLNRLNNQRTVVCPASLGG